MSTPTALRSRLVDLLRRDLIGPAPGDTDLATELLPERPGRWYLTSYIVPAPDSETAEDDETEQDLPDIAETPDPVPGGGRAEDEGETTTRVRPVIATSPPASASLCRCRWRCAASMSPSPGATTRPNRR